MQCWQCGAAVQPGDRACGYCGARLTPPPAGRSQRSSQQRYSSPRNQQRRSRDDEWDSDAQGDDYAGEYAPGGESAYGATVPRSGRRGGRGGPRSNADGDWDDPEPRPDWRRDRRGRSRAGQQPYDEYGSYPQDDYGQSGVYGGDYASQAYDAPREPQPRESHEPQPREPQPREPQPREPDPLDDPRAPRSLRTTPRRGSDAGAGAGYPPGDAPSRRPPTDPSRDRRRDESGYRQGGAPDPYADSYGGASHSRHGSPSSADNRYSRSSVSRGRPAPYGERGDGYGRGGYGGAYGDEYGDGYGDDYGDGYSDEYSEQRPASRQGYGRRMPTDEHSAWYQQVGARARGLQQRWGDTLSSLRIPGTRPHEESGGKSSPRRLVTTIVLLLALAAAVVAGVVVVGPRVLQRFRPAAATSSLCVASGGAKAGVAPTPDSHFKPFTSTRSHYSVNYPETWTVEPQQKASSGYDYIDEYTLPNSSTLVSIEQPQAVCGLSDANIIQGEIAAAQQQKITFTETATAARTQTIGGEQWQRREYDVTDQGVTLHMVILACHHQGRAYVIVLVSRSTTFAQDNKGIFEPMLQSFTFTE